MSAPVVAVVAVAGLLAGLVVAELVARLPDPSDVPRAVRAVIAVLNGGAWGVVAWTWDRWWQVIPYAVLASTLVCVSAIDIRAYRIPNKVVFPSLGLSVVLLLVATAQLSPADSGEFYRGALVGAALYFVSLFLPHLIYPKGMGMGDVKLALVMGLYLGWGHPTIDVIGIVISALFLGCVLGVVSGIVVNVLRRHGGAFPFGPSLAVGCFIVLVQATGAPL
jgi:leader peptidase (prepilin peptidase)/N-methyltransferase